MKQRKIYKIPQLFSWLIDFFISDSDVFHLKGDYEEIYDGIHKENGKFRATLWILKQITFSAILYFTESTFWSVTMFKNYLKIACRNIFKHKGYSTINILGLAIGIACTILILQWVQDELSYDRFHKNADHLYVATFSNGSKVTPTALAGFLKSEYPEVMNTSRLSFMGRNLIKYGEKETNEDGGIMVDPSFLQMFTIPFIQGDPTTALNDPHSILISERLAEKYFGAEDAVNKMMTVAASHDLMVTGVFENYPPNSHIYFEYIIPLTLSLEWNRNLNTWDWNDIRNYVQLQDNTPVQSVDRKISDVVERHRPQDKRPISLQSITRLHLYRFNESGGLIAYVYMFSAMAFFILLIACINFMNLTTARSTARAKEVGIRKTVGAGKFHLIRQFFSESILLTIFSLVIGIILVILFLPVFNSLTGKHFTLQFLYQQTTVFGIIGITLLTGMIAGSYPALFLSHFQPVKVLKGALTSGMKSSLFRKILVVTQFTLSILLILGTLMIYRQVHFMRTRELGFDRENIVYLSIGGRFRQNIDTIRAEMLKNPNILNVTLTDVAPYRWSSNAGVGDVHWEGKTNQQVKMVMTSVDYNYLETIGLEMVHGRFFSKEYATDASEAYVVNEAAVRAMEMEEPIGKELRVWDLGGRIIGVVKDYHFESLHHDIIPMAMRIRPNWYSMACIRINPNNVTAALSFLEEKWEEMYPEYPFEYRFLDDTINNQYRSEDAIGRIVKYFTFLAIFISSLGLFGLASFSTEQRTKEIGIRKVCGASTPGLLMLLSKEFFKLVIFACLIATPAAYYIMNGWFRNFAYRIGMDIGVVLLAAMSSLLIAFLTVSYHSIKAARANPIDALRYE